MMFGHLAKIALGVGELAIAPAAVLIALPRPRGGRHRLGLLHLGRRLVEGLFHAVNMRPVGPEVKSW